MTSSVSAEELKRHLLQSLERVAPGDERLIVLEDGKPIAALVSIEDLRRLEALDDAPQDAEEAGHPIMRVFGHWKEREDLDDLIAEIYADRQASPGREVSL
jgi:prevent-host-death family protein